MRDAVIVRQSVLDDRMQRAEFWTRWKCSEMWHYIDKNNKLIKQVNFELQFAKLPKGKNENWRLITIGEDD